MKISIIIPVYNGEKFINRCIDSILKQSYSNFELILIDDGSKDNSLDILNQYQRMNEGKVFVYSQKNSGAASARNNGIERATGDYITFIDCDDYIEKDYLERLVKKLYHTDVDVVVSGYIKTSYEGKDLFKKIPKKCYWSLFKYSTNWGNLYRTNFIRSNHINFHHYRIAEDIDFTLQCIVKLNSYLIVEYAGYHYFMNDNSVTNTINASNKINELSPSLNSMNEVACNENYKYKNELYYYYFKTSIFNAFMQRKKISVSRLSNLLYKEYQLILSFHLISKTRVFIWMKGEDMSVNILVNLFHIALKWHLVKPLLWLLKMI